MQDPVRVLWSYVDIDERVGEQPNQRLVVGNLPPDLAQRHTH